MVCVVHPQMDGALQNELGALLALNFEQVVKGEMVFVLYRPSFLSPSRSLIVVLTLILTLSNLEKYDIYY
jgi:hypothetical protein